MNLQPVRRHTVADDVFEQTAAFVRRALDIDEMLAAEQ